MQQPQASSAQAATPRTMDSLPGPPGLPVLGNALQIESESFHRQVEAWAATYGSVFRFRIAGRRFIGVSDPEVISSVLRRRPQVFRKGSRLVQVAKDLGMHGVFSANDDAWKRQRQLVMPALDPAHLRTYLPAIVAVTLALRQRWQRAAAEGADIDLLADLMRYTVDVTTCLAFGHNLNTMEQGDEAAIQHHLNVIFPVLFRRVLAPVDVQHWWPDREVQAHVRALRTAVEGFLAEARRQVAADPSLRENPRNLIQALVVAHEQEGAGISDEDVAGNVLTMLLAGEDTTANTLAWMLWLLARNPQALAKAQAEVDAAFGRGAVPEALDRLASLDYLEACANEAMRLKPVAPINIVEAAEDAIVADVLVPKGAFVLCVMRAPGLDAARFPEPQAFRPERWLAGDAAGSAAEGMFSAKRTVMPFGAGPRVCPGRYLALAEIKMVAAMLLSNFELAEVRAPGEEPRERLSLVMAPVGLRMKLTLRSAEAGSP